MKRRIALKQTKLGTWYPVDAVTGEDLFFELGRGSGLEVSPVWDNEKEARAWLRNYNAVMGIKPRKKKRRNDRWQKQKRNQSKKKSQSRS